VACGIRNWRLFACRFRAGPALENFVAAPGLTSPRRYPPPTQVEYALSEAGKQQAVEAGRQLSGELTQRGLAPSSLQVEPLVLSMF
jgi:hypothetical protein